jgi:hypothetical protein
MVRITIPSPGFWARSREVRAVAVGEADVGDDDVRRGPVDHAQGVSDPVGLTDDLEPVGRAERESEPTPDQVVVVDEHDPDLSSGCFPGVRDRHIQHLGHHHLRCPQGSPGAVRQRPEQGWRRRA